MPAEVKGRRFIPKSVVRIPLFLHSAPLPRCLVLSSKFQQGSQLMLGGGCSGSFTSVCGLALQFSCSVVSDSLQPHGLQHARLPCPSPTPGACSHSCPSSWWCRPTTSSSALLLTGSKTVSVWEHAYHGVASLHVASFASGFLHAWGKGRICPVFHKYMSLGP